MGHHCARFLQPPNGVPHGCGVVELGLLRPAGWGEEVKRGAFYAPLLGDGDADGFRTEAVFTCGGHGAHHAAIGGHTERAVVSGSAHAGGR